MLKANFCDKVFAITQATSFAQQGEWIQHNFTLTPAASAPDVNNTLTITFDFAV